MSLKDNSWQDEVRRKKQQALEKEIEREREEINRKEKIAVIWNKFIEANSKLDKDIRLPLRKGKEDSTPPPLDVEILGLDNSYCLYYELGYRISYGRTFYKNNELHVEPITIKGLKIGVVKGEIIMGCVDHIDSQGNKHYLEYEYGENTIDLLLKNLCMGNSIQSGLKVSKKFGTDDGVPYVSKGGCFIATAAYGSSLSNKVIALEIFRDNYLLRKSLGKVLVNFYYTISPILASIISKNKILRMLTRACLYPIVEMVKRLSCIKD